MSSQEAKRLGLQIGPIIAALALAFSMHWQASESREVTAGQLASHDARLSAAERQCSEAYSMRADMAEVKSDIRWIKQRLIEER